MMLRYFLPLLPLLLAVATGCSSSAEGKAEASTGNPKPTPAPAAAAPKASRIQTLLGVSGSEVPPASKSPFTGASVDAPAGWAVEPSDDLWSALDTSTAKAMSAHCYMTERLQPGDPMPGIKLWASSAGGKPAAFKGPEPIELGPDKVPADLYYGEGGITLGQPGGKADGITIAIRPKARPKLVVLGIVKADAPEATKKKLAGCLESFKLKK